MRAGQRDWNEIGRLDPLWAIVSWPDKEHGRWDVGEFFAFGQQEVDGVLAAARQWGVPTHYGSALDFGSGVGRLTRGMTAHFSRVVGVDISDAMVLRARELNSDIPACSFAVLDHTGLAAFEGRSFDFIYSSLVLQHMTDRALIEQSLREFVRLLAEGGLLVFQLPSSIPLRRRLQPRPRAYTWLRRLGFAEGVLYGRLGLHPIRMNALPEESVVKLLASVGASVRGIDRAVWEDSGISNRIYYVTVDPTRTATSESV